MRAVVLLAVLVTLGCLAPTAEDVAPAAVAPADWAARAVGLNDPGHDHDDATEHVGLSTPNFEVLGWDPLVTDYHGFTSGGYYCGDVASAEGRRVAVVASFLSDVAFVMMDVTDPARPVKMGELALPLTHTYDLALTPDARYVLVGTSPLDLGPDKTPSPGVARTAATWRDACGRESVVGGAEDNAPWASGLLVVDVGDPTAPRIVDYRPLPAMGAHGVFAIEHDGRTIVLASVTNMAVAADYFALFTLEDGRLVTQSVVRPVPAAEWASQEGGHVDGWIGVHPSTGALTAFLALWTGGVAIYDATDLREPREIGRWNAWPQDSDACCTHEALPMAELWDGRHYTVLGPEIGARLANSPTGVIQILDTTDPTAPERVGAWTLPVDPEWDRAARWSTHYVAVVGRTLFVALWHGGVWAVDLTDPAAPRSVGAFIPDRVSPSPNENFGSQGPLVQDVETFPEGDMAIWDWMGGLYMVRFDATRPPPPVAEWPLAR